MLKNRSLLTQWAHFVYDNCEDPQNPLMHTDTDFDLISIIYQMCCSATSHLWHIDPNDEEDYWETVKVRVLNIANSNNEIVRPALASGTRTSKRADNRFKNWYMKTKS